MPANSDISMRRKAAPSPKVSAANIKKCPASPGPFELRNFCSGEFALAVVAPAEHEQRDGGSEKTKDRHPPNVPNQRKTRDRGKEGGDDADRTAARHL